jgi:outer membrane receptor for ferrienterochelin and colicins
MTRLAPRVQAALLLSTACFWVIPAVASAQTADPAILPPPEAVQIGGKRVYTPADFARFAPRNALDMLRQVPGFTIRQAVEERGLGQASENVLLNGQRVSNKSGGAIAELAKIPASNVERIEIVDAATLDIAGLTGQVANLVTRTETKASGQFSWRPEFRAHFADPLFSRGDISYSGSAGPVDYTLGINNGASRSGAGGPTVIIDPVTGPFEFRDDRWRSSWDSPRLSGRFTYDPPGSSAGNLNLAYAPAFYSYEETGIRERPDGVDRTRTVRQRRRGYNYEIGGDYNFALGPGELKLIGLRRFDSEPVTSTAIIDFADGRPSIGDRFRRDGRMGEWIGRGEYSWKTGDSDWQVAGEAAFNRLNSVTEIFNLQPSGEFTQIPFPAGTGQVQEDRYEVLGTYGRSLGESLTLQLVAGGEYSKLSSESAGNSLVRSFFRPKGSVSLAWQANSNLDVSLRVRRRVEQLNFYDFLASVNLTEDRQNAGNLELVPPQSWEVDLEFNKKLGRWGNTSLRPYARLTDDHVDFIPIGQTGESRGNIDSAHRYGIEWKGTWLFDPLGWTGAKLDSHIRFQRSRVRDPLTGQMRPISGSPQREVQLNLRHDVPRTSWAWGSNFSYFRSAKAYRLTEVGRMWEGPFWLSAFVEHKDVMGLTVQASVNNILNARSRWDRAVYSGFRDSNPLLFVERRDRLIGPIFTFSVRGNF